MKETNNQHLNSSESNRKKSFSQKTKDFTKKVADAVEQTLTDAVDTTKKTLTGLAIAGSTLLPASFETIAPTAAKGVIFPTAAALVTACQDDIDTTPPRIDIVQKNLEIQGGETLRISGNQVYVGNTLIFRCSDDVSSSINISATFNGKAISSGYTFNESGTLSIKASDESGNTSAPASAKIDILNNAPIINLKQSEVNIFGGVKVTITDNQLLFGNEIIAEWKDDKTQNCKVSFKVDGVEVKSGETLDKSGQGILSVTDDNGNTSSEKISISNQGINGLENLKNLNIQVDKEVDLLKGISLANGVELVKVEIEIDGQRYEITDPHHYAPEYPGTCKIIFTVKSKSGTTAEIKSESLTIKAIEYNPITPQEANIYKNRNEWKKNVEGDKERYKFYETIGHLQTRKIVEELIKNGSPEYLEKLNNIRLIGLGEQPRDDCPYIQGTRDTDNPNIPDKKTQHAEILNEKIKTSTSTPGIAQNYPGKILRFPHGNRSNIWEYVNNHPNQNFIFFCANNWISGTSEQDNPKKTEEGKALTKLINSEKCIAIISVGNVNAGRDYALRWDQPYIPRGEYNASGAIGPNIIGAIGGTTEAITLNDYDYYPYEHSAKPIGYNQKNLKVSSSGYPAHESATSFAAQSNRASSRPAGELAATLWNIAALNPEMSMSDVMNLINSHYISIPATHNGQPIENYNTPDQKEICRQICLPSIPSQLSATQPTNLPKDSKYPAILWTGKGVEYLDNGQRKSAQNITNPSEIYKIAKICKIRFNPELFKKQGGKDTAELTVQVITSEGKNIPEIKKNVSIKVR